MKFCKHCGAELVDEAVVCPKCGCAVEEIAAAPAAQPMKTGFVAAIIGFILAVLALGLGCIPILGYIFAGLFGTPALVLTIIGLVFSSRAKKVEMSKKAKTAFVLSLIGLILSILAPVVAVVMLFVLL